MKIHTLEEALAALETERELRECAERNVTNLMHYADGKPYHAPLSGYALQVRDKILEMRNRVLSLEKQVDDLENELVHGPEDDEDDLEPSGDQW